jgi:1,4-alpha-glucan branching enzyme
MKWNLDWLNSGLEHLSQDSDQRRHHFEEITSGVRSAFAENFVLPLPHDYASQEHRILIGKMPGEEWQRYADLRLFLGLMYAHPGKKGQSRRSSSAAVSRLIMPRYDPGIS